MKKFISVLLASSVAGVFLLAGCGSSSKSYKDGTYEGSSSVYENEDGSEDYSYRIYDGTLEETWDKEEYYSMGGFETPEEALDAAILDTLETL